tara:strand:- start:2433 stop:3518 length:1086 start_codon:yes stop_codon:yes gene_type:complete
MIYIFLNSIINGNDLILNIKSFALIRFPLFILFPFIFEFKNISNLNNRIIIIVKIILFLFIVDLFIQYFLGENILGYKYNDNYQRASGFFNDENIAGSFLFFTFVIYLSYTFAYKYDEKNLYFLLLIYLAIFISGDRTPFIMINLFLFINFIWFFKKLSKNFFYILKFFIYIIIGLFIIFLIKPEAIDKYTNTAKAIVKDINTEKIQDYKYKKKFIFERWDYYSHYTKAYVIYKNNKLIGTGYKSFRFVCDDIKYNKDYSKFTNNLKRNGCSTHPHNIYMEVLSDLGLIGFILLILFIYNMLMMKKLISNEYLRVFYIAFLITYFFPLKPFGSFYTNIQLIFMTTTISYIIFIDRLRLNKK